MAGEMQHEFWMECFFLGSTVSICILVLGRKVSREDVSSFPHFKANRPILFGYITFFFRAPCLMNHEKCGMYHHCFEVSHVSHCGLGKTKEVGMM